jgi:oligopeptide transport system permease protein
MSRATHRPSVMARLPRTSKVALCVMLALIALAFALPWLPLEGSSAAALDRQLEPPSSAHLFGTDLLGRDVFSRTLFGIRSSLIVSLLAAVVSLCIGVAVGALAGYAGGNVDRVLMRLVDVLYGIPFICLVIFLLAVLRDHEPWLRARGITRETVLYAAVGATTWLTMARLVRGEVVRLKTEPFVEAARALGLRPSRVLLRHVLPNAFGVIAVALTLSIPAILQYEAFLSFLGLGVEPPGVSLGLLAAEGVEALSPLSSVWWLVAFPGGALALLLLCFSLLGDGLRDAVDPRR